MPTATFTPKPPAPPVENPAPPPAQAQPAAPSITPPGQQPQPAGPSVTPSDQPPPASVSPAVVIGGWYGASCDEPEGTFYYRWSIDLMQNPADGSYAGTVKFHNCPDGGRVGYRVTGPSQTGPLITLAGARKEGDGDLFNSAAERMDFSFDLSTGQISPNLSP